MSKATSAIRDIPASCSCFWAWEPPDRWVIVTFAWFCAWHSAQRTTGKRQP